MSPRNLEDLIDRMAKTLRSYVDRMLEPITARMTSAERLLAELPLPKDGKDGKDGRDGPTLEEVVNAVLEKLGPAIDEKVRAAVDAIPKPRDGADGQPGQPGASVTLDDVKPVLDQAVESLRGRVQEALDAIPEVRDGKDGRDGQDGTSVTVDDLRPVLLEMVAGLPKPKDGEPGQPGRDGQAPSQADLVALINPLVAEAVGALPRARDGRDGRDVTEEEVDRIVQFRLEAAMERLPKPRDGRDGRDGSAGRDAAQISILPSIQSDRSYQRGTYASHDGGLLYAVRDTDPLGNEEPESHGWMVLVEGVSAVVVSQASEREFTVVCRLTSGRQAVTKLSLPVLIDRGVYKEGTAYTSGDGVTWDGSFWIAQEATQDKPGTSKAWRLAVKRGRDGKDGKDGSPATKARSVRTK